MPVGFVKHAAGLGQEHAGEVDSWVIGDNWEKACMWAWLGKLACMHARRGPCRSVLKTSLFGAWGKLVPREEMAGAGPRRVLGLVGLLATYCLGFGLYACKKGAMQLGPN